MARSIPTEAAPGAPFTITANWRNYLRQMALEYEANGGRFSRPPAPPTSAVHPLGQNQNDALARNIGGGQASAYTLVRVRGVVTVPEPTPADDNVELVAGTFNSFAFSPTLTFDQDFTSMSPADVFAVPMQHVPAGQVGRIRIAGLAQCRVDVQDLADRTAGPSLAPAASNAISGVPGPPIAYKTPGLGVRWCLLSLGPNWADVMRYQAKGAIPAKSEGTADLLYWSQANAVAAGHPGTTGVADSGLVVWQEVQLLNLSNNDIADGSTGHASFDMTGGKWQALTEDCPAP